LVGARHVQQIEENLAALADDILEDALGEMSRISGKILQHVPDTGNFAAVHFILMGQTYRCGPDKNNGMNKGCLTRNRCVAKLSLP